MERGYGEIEQRARELADRVNLGHRIEHLSIHLSGGEQQRVAIARALINDPEIIFADEPTGSLDTNSASNIMDILGALHKRGMTIVLVTHEEDICEIRYKGNKDGGCSIVEDRRV